MQGLSNNVEARNECRSTVSDDIVIFDRHMF